MGERERRIGLNEALFREVNERVEEVNRTFSTFTGSMDIMCECGDAGCADRITVPISEYERIRADSTLFAVVQGHEAPDVEDVVERHDGFDVVRKHEGTPAAIAEKTDPRRKS